MIKDLTIINKDGLNVVDSRQVAEMVGKEHYNLLRDIETYCQYLLTSNLRAIDFFFEDEYVASNGKVNPMYYITKKGCDMIANKMTGEKGVLFTATYINRFEEMEEFIKKQNEFLNGSQYDIITQQINSMAAQTVNFMTTTTKFAIDTQMQIQKLTEDLDRADAQFYKAMDLVVVRRANVSHLTTFLKEKLTEFCGQEVTANNSVYRFVKSKLFKKFKLTKWEDIKIGNFNEVHSFIDSITHHDILGAIYAN